MELPENLKRLKEELEKLDPSLRIEKRKEVVRLEVKKTQTFFRTVVINEYIKDISPQDLDKMEFVDLVIDNPEEVEETLESGWSRDDENVEDNLHRLQLNVDCDPLLIGSDGFIWN